MKQRTFGNSAENMNRSSRSWIVTIPAKDWKIYRKLPDWIQYMTGQLELSSSGFLHWQLFVKTKDKIRWTKCAKLFNVPSSHWEPTYSNKAEEYCNKIESRYGGRFEIGKVDLRFKDSKMTIEQFERTIWNDINNIDCSEPSRANTCEGCLTYWNHELYCKNCINEMINPDIPDNDIEESQ